MVNEKFRILKQNIKNTPACDLSKSQLYDVSFMMTREQLKEYAKLLHDKGIVSYEYGHAYGNDHYLIDNGVGSHVDERAIVFRFGYYFQTFLEHLRPYSD